MAIERTADPTPVQVPPKRAGQAPVVGAVALGGVLGAWLRYGAGLVWPAAPDAFPWTTLVVNVVGCAVIGFFLVAITEVWRPHPLLRPFFGTGVLGGFTTFSTYAVDINRLVEHGEPARALGYLAGTLIAALTAVWTAAALTRRLLGGIGGIGGLGGAR